MGNSYKKESEITNLKNQIAYAMSIENVNLRIKLLEKCLKLCDDIHDKKYKNLINDCIIDANKII